MRTILSFWKPIVWAMVVLFLSLLSGNVVNEASLMQIPHIDKVAHFGMYFVFTFLLIWDFSRYKEKNMSWKKIIFYSILIAVAFGGSMELFQEIHTLHRSTDIKDFIANSAGACTAAVVFRSIDTLYTKMMILIKPKSDLSL
jgi:VanZ family protein